MKSKNTYSVRDALDNLHRMDSSLWKGWCRPTPNQLDFIPAPDEVAAKRHPGREEMTHLMRFIRSMYPCHDRRFRPQRQHGGARFPAGTGSALSGHHTRSDNASNTRQARHSDAWKNAGFAGNRLKVLLNRVPDRGKPDPRRNREVSRAPVRRDFPQRFHGALRRLFRRAAFCRPASPLGKELRALADSIRARAAGERAHGRRKTAARRRPCGLGKRWFSFFQKARLQKTQGQRVRLSRDKTWRQQTPGFGNGERAGGGVGYSSGEPRSYAAPSIRN